MLYNSWDEQPLMEEMNMMSCKWRTLSYQNQHQKNLESQLSYQCFFDDNWQLCTMVGYQITRW
jgi:hypothetical protein